MHQPWPRRKTLLALSSVLIVAAAAFAWGWGPQLWQRARLLYWQRQCLNFTAPPSTVVYEEDPAAAAVLIRSGAGYSPYRKPQYRPQGYTGSAVVAAMFRPLCEDQLEKSGFVVPQQWGSFQPGAIVFLHERVSPAGHHRLVCIWSAPISLGHDPDLRFYVCVASPATPFKEMRPQFANYGSQIPPRYPPPPVARIFTGQPDQVDASHFTIQYQMWGQDDVLDGWLQDDDSIRFTPRHPPTPPPH